VTPPPREDRHNCPSLARGYHEVVGVDKIYKYIRRVFQPTPFTPKQKYRRDHPLPNKVWEGLKALSSQGGLQKMGIGSVLLRHLR